VLGGFSWLFGATGELFLAHGKKNVAQHWLKQWDKFICFVKYEDITHEYSKL
jgi:hypothetical protein